MILKTVTSLALRLVRRSDAPERPLIFAPPCQSELKRTLRHGGLPPKPAYSRGFNLSCDAHSTRMVNDRFPARSIYGFEMVDAPIAPTFLCLGHQSKIYAESNHSGFRRIFAEFTSMQILAIYRRLIVRSKPAGLTATEPKETTGVATCFFCFA
jgi:hypothetical protein